MQEQAAANVSPSSSSSKKLNRAGDASWKKMLGLNRAGDTQGGSGGEGGGREGLQCEALGDGESLAMYVVGGDKLAILNFNSRTPGMRSILSTKCSYVY
jgi:hypothetical protein